MSLRGIDLLHHRPTRQSTYGRSASAFVRRQIHMLLTRITSAEQDPWRSVGLHIITPRHGQVNILGKVDEIANGLLDCQELETLRCKVVIRIGVPEETVLDEDGSPMLLLSDHTTDGFVGEVNLIACKSVR
jgi:hypothetical protein